MCYQNANVFTVIYREVSDPAKLTHMDCSSHDGTFLHFLFLHTQNLLQTVPTPLKQATQSKEGEEASFLLVIAFRDWMTTTGHNVFIQYSPCYKISVHFVHRIPVIQLQNVTHLRILYHFRRYLLFSRMFVTIKQGLNIVTQQEIVEFISLIYHKNHTTPGRIQSNYFLKIQCIS